MNAATSLDRTANSRYGVVADQAVNACSNLLVNILIARSVTPHEFGAFGLAYAGYLVLLGVSRAFGSDVVAVFGNTRRDPTALSGGLFREWMGRSALGLSTLIGVAAGLTYVVAGVLVPPLGSLSIIFGIGLPVLLAQDSVRAVNIASANGRAAILSDLVWLAAQGTLSAALLATGVRDARLLLAIWIIGAAFGLTASAWVSMFPLAPLHPRAFWSSYCNVGGRYCLEFIAGYGAIQLYYYGLAGLAGIDAVAGLRGAYTVLGPANTLMNGALLAIVPDLARRRSAPKSDFVRAAVTYSLCVGFAVALVSFPLVLLPGSLGHVILGASWSLTFPFVVPIGGAILGNALAVGARGGIRAVGLPRKGLPLRLALAPISAALAMSLAAYGPQSSAFGLMIGNVVGCGALWAQLIWLLKSWPPIPDQSRYDLMTAIDDAGWAQTKSR